MRTKGEKSVLAKVRRNGGMRSEEDSGERQNRSSNRAAVASARSRNSSMWAGGISGPCTGNSHATSSVFEAALHLARESSLLIWRLNIPARFSWICVSNPNGNTLLDTHEIRSIRWIEEGSLQYDVFRHSLRSAS